MKLEYKDKFIFLLLLNRSKFIFKLIFLQIKVTFYLRKKKINVLELILL
jgi:hypothetical protein